VVVDDSSSEAFAEEGDMPRPRSRTLAGLVIGLALVPCIAFGQITTATVSGAVRDAQGNMVPGATVTLVSDTRGVHAAETTTDATGTFVFPNTAPDTYSVQVVLQGFKTLKVSGFIVSPGDRLALPAFTIEVGTLEETVTVTGESPLIQAASGERSFDIPTTSVESFPIQSRNFRDLALSAPGVMAGQNAGVQRIGGGGYANIMMDGISAMDTGNNGQMIQMNLDAVAEVKVLVNSYQAEYGRSSGIQVMSVTKSGTNQFRGTLYDIERHSRWNKNSWVNIQNGVPRTLSDQRDWGYAVGGPVGKPGGSNKLFFFYSHEFRPRTGGNTDYYFRVPTALERQGDFSQSRDNLGNLYPYVKDWTTGLPCSASDTRGCFQDGGVLGKVPASRLYGPGMNLLNMYPIQPNVQQTAGMNYNVHQLTPTIKTLGYQPAVRVDYQVTSPLRVAFKFNAHNTNSGLPKQYGVVGAAASSNYAIDGLNDSLGNQKPWVTTMSASANYNLGAKTFLEAIWGRTQNFYASVSTAPLSNRYTAKLDGIPDIYTTNRDVNPAYWMAGALSQLTAPFYVDGKIQLPQYMTYGTRSGNAPSTPQYPGWLNINQTWDLAGSVTHVRGRHTIKGGIGFNHSFKAQNMTQGVFPMGTIDFQEMTNNPYDTSFGFANVATGVFYTYSQASKFIESGIVYTGVEPYIQDNWKVSQRLTLDYGLRFVHLQPEHDTYGQAANFFPEQWDAANAPLLYVPGCPGGVYPCPSTRQAMNPKTGQLLGAGTAGLIGQRIPGTGSLTNGIKQQGQGISSYNFEYPFLKVGPRVGVAYLLRPDGKWVLRGGFGLFYDRVEGNYTMSQSANPPTAESTTLYYGQLQNMSSGPASGGVPTLVIYRYKNPNLPTSATWNIGVQMDLPYSFTLDASYVGQHAYDMQGAQGGQQVTNLNAIDLGTSFQAKYQDPTLAASTVPGQTPYTNNLLRYYQGYGNINQFSAVFHRTSHGLQFSLQRRFSHGFSAGLNWNWTLKDTGNYSADYLVTQRMEHRADGTVGLRADQKQFEELMKDQGTPTHILMGTFVWNLPNLHGSGPAAKAVGYLVNDWLLSGVWSAQTGAGYSIGYSYQANGLNLNLTGSPDIPPRVRIVGDPGSGCSSNQYAQFNTAAFAGPIYPSDGMESGRNYLHACGRSIWDLAIVKNVRLGGRRSFQARVEVYNILNSSTFTTRNTSVTLNNPVAQVVQNPQYNADGSLVQSRLKPNAAGFGAATGTVPPLTIQAQIRFSF
jgi:hypothetical protein